MRLTLDTRNAAGVVANLYAADARAQRAIRRVNRASGVRLHAAVQRDCPRDTGFMASQTRLRFSEGGLVYNVGWEEADFSSAGLAFYPLYVIFGTRTMPARDVLFSNRDLEAPRYRAELREALRQAIGRRAGRGR